MADGNTRLTIAVVGTSFGLRAHVPGLQAAGYDIVALVGRDPERTARRAANAGIPNACTSLAQALDLGPDVVAVTTGPAEHYELCAQALDAGCHVVCEKPFTLDLGQAKDLQARAAAGGRVAYIAHEFRFTPALALFGQVIADGLVGTPRMLTIAAQTQLLADPGTPRPDWWFDPARGGGWLGASGTHGIDLVRCWLGEIAAVSCRTWVTSDRAGDIADDSFSLSFVTRSGVEGVMQSSGAAWGKSLSIIRVAGDQGSAWIDDTTGAGNVEATAGPVMVGDRNGVREIDVPAGLALPAVPPALMRGHSVPHFAKLYDVLRDEIGGHPLTGWPRPATFADGIREMTVLETARASARQGGRWLEVEA